MVIVRLIGRMGNQLFQYAVGRQLALRNKMPLKIDMSANEPTVENKLTYFNIDAPLATEEEVKRMVSKYESHSFYSRAYRKIERKLLPRHKRKYFKEKGYYEYDADLIKITSSVLLEGFWQHHQYFEKLHPRLWDELTLRDEYIFEHKIFQEIVQAGSSISIHIRRGDYVSDPNNLNWFGVMPISYYQNAISYMDQHVKNPVYFVFSDDLDWAERNLSIKAPVVFVDIDGGKKDYLELYAMSKCRHNIIANSSFSWWAAFLNKNEDKKIIAPKTWLAVEELNKKVTIQMPSWIKM